MRRALGVCFVMLSIGQVQADPPPPPPDCDQIFQMALQECGISAVEGDNCCSLVKVGGGGLAALGAALRCLADKMAQTECEEASATLNGIPVTWGRDHNGTKGECTIAIATSTTKSVVIAGATGERGSAYASGGSSGGSDADAAAPKGCAHAVGGHATPGSNKDGGDAKARANIVAIGDPGNGDGTGSKGKVSTKSIGPEK